MYGEIIGYEVIEDNETKPRAKRTESVAIIHAGVMEIRSIHL